MRLADKKIRAQQIVKKIVESIQDNEELEKGWNELDDDEEKEIMKNWENIIILNLPNGKNENDKLN